MSVADLDRLPAPYPGELWYSVIARDIAASNFLHRDHRPRAVLGGLTSTINVAFPNRVHRLVDHLRGRFAGNVLDFARRHTLLPYVLSFEHAERMPRLLADSASRDRALSVVTGNMRSPWRHHFLRYCRSCRHEDLQRVGEPYWHVLHQLPSVCHCYVHRDPLLDSLVPFEPARHDFVTAHDGVCPVAKGATQSLAGTAGFPARQIAGFSLRAAAAAAGTLHLTATEYADLFKAAGFEGENGSIASTRLATELRKYLASHGAGSTHFSRRDWWRSAYTRLSYRLWPVQHMLMRLFLVEQLAPRAGSCSQRLDWRMRLMGAAA